VAGGKTPVGTRGVFVVIYCAVLKYKNTERFEKDA